MPKPTFWNLPDEKRRALVEAALEEFAGHDFDSASISRLVERLGIAKGSLYQYFEDKKELFLYLVGYAQDTLMSAILNDPPPEAGFFAALRWQMSATSRAALRFPLHARLVERAYSAPLPFHDQMLESGRKLRREHLQAMIASGMRSGEISNTLDTETALFLVETVVAGIGPYLTHQLGLQPEAAPETNPALFSSPQVERIFDQVIAALQHGLVGAG